MDPKDPDFNTQKPRRMPGLLSFALFALFPPEIFVTVLKSSNLRSPRRPNGLILASAPAPEISG